MHRNLQTAMPRTKATHWQISSRLTATHYPPLLTQRYVRLLSGGLGITLTGCALAGEQAASGPRAIAFAGRNSSDLWGERKDGAATRLRANAAVGAGAI